MLRKNAHDPGSEVVESQVTTARLVGPGREPREVYPDAYDAAAAQVPGESPTATPPLVPASEQSFEKGGVVAFSTPKGQIQ